MDVLHDNILVLLARLLWVQITGITPQRVVVRISSKIAPVRLLSPFMKCAELNVGLRTALREELVERLDRPLGRIYVPCAVLVAYDPERASERYFSHACIPT